MCIFGFAKPVTFVYKRKHIIITSFNTKLWRACTQQVLGRGVGGVGGGGGGGLGLENP